MVVGVVCVFVGTLTDQERAERSELETANRLLADQARTREQLAATRERVRMARDLHDTLAHTLAALVVQLETVEAALEDSATLARRQLAQASELARQGLQNAREAILDLRATQVKDLGLAGALRRHIEQAALWGSANTQTDIQLETDGSEPALSDAVAEGLVRIAQEALNNAVRHAQASRVVVRLSVKDLKPAVLEVQVQDDGRGFDLNQRDDGRFGLAGMRERAELIGAQFQIHSVAGHGTTVTVRLELPEERSHVEDSRAGGR
jgi:signal transduction histidine kinase